MKTRIEFILLTLLCQLSPISDSLAASPGTSLLTKGYKHLRSNDFIKAVNEFSEVLKHDQKNFAALKGRAVAYYSIGQDEKSAQDASTALFINPNDQNMKAIFIEALLHQNKFEEVILEATNRIKNGGGWEDYLDRAHAYECIGNWKEAIADCDRAYATGDASIYSALAGIKEFCEKSSKEGRKPYRCDMRDGPRTNLCNRLDYDAATGQVLDLTGDLTPPDKKK